MNLRGVVVTLLILQVNLKVTQVFSLRLYSIKTVNSLNKGSGNDRTTNNSTNNNSTIDAIYCLYG